MFLQPLPNFHLNNKRERKSCLFYQWSEATSKVDSLGQGLMTSFNEDNICSLKAANLSQFWQFIGRVSVSVKHVRARFSPASTAFLTYLPSFSLESPSVFEGSECIPSWTWHFNPKSPLKTKISCHLNFQLKNANKFYVVPCNPSTATKEPYPFSKSVFPRIRHSTRMQ